MNFSKQSKSLITQSYHYNNQAKRTKCALLQITQKTARFIASHLYHTLCSFEMILSKSYDVKMPKKYKKIQYLHAAFNDTFVFLALITDRRDGVVHVDSKGKVLFQAFFEHPMDTMGMLNDKQAIFLQTRKNRIAVLNLEYHQFSYYPHQFMTQQSDQSDIITFSQTRYLCIEEKGRYNDNRYKLTYYNYPLQLNEKKVARSLVIYEAKDNEWTYEHETRKANNYSMMLWHKPRHDDSFEFKSYEISEGKGQLRHYRYPHSIASKDLHQKVEVVIFNAWQIRKSHFLFLCWTAEGARKNQSASINSNYVIDVGKNGKIRESNFNFGPFQDYLIDCYNLGPNAIFRTFKFEEGKILKTPTYYIDNLTESLMAEEVWQCSYLYKYEFEGYTSGLLCEGLYENVDVDRFKVNLKRIVHSKEVYTLLLSECGQELNEDLMADVLFVLG